jgi:hypothetical protein
LVLQGRCALCAECIGIKLCCRLVRLTWHMSQLPWPKLSIHPLCTCILHRCLTTGEVLVRPCHLCMHFGLGQRRLYKQCGSFRCMRGQARMRNSSRLSASGISARNCGACGMCCVRRYTAVGRVGDGHFAGYAEPGSCSTGRWQRLHCGCASARHVLFSCQGCLLLLL